MCSIAFRNFEKKVSSKDLLYYAGCRLFGHYRTVDLLFSVTVEWSS